MAHNGLIIIKKARWGLASKQGVMANSGEAFCKLGITLRVINRSSTSHRRLDQGWMLSSARAGRDHARLGWRPFWDELSFPFAQLAGSHWISAQQGLGKCSQAVTSGG